MSVKADALRPALTTREPRAVFAGVVHVPAPSDVNEAGLPELLLVGALSALAGQQTVAAPFASHL
jgi:hypothetical protein